MQHTVRELQKELKNIGFKRKRVKGDHEIWSNNKENIVIPLKNLNYKIGIKIFNRCKYYKNAQ